MLMFFSSFLMLYTIRAHTIAGRHIYEGSNYIAWRSGPAGSLFPCPRGSGGFGILVPVSEVDSFIYRYLIKSWVLVGLSILAWIGTGLFMLKSIRRK
jgi:hypothetical protein